MQKLSLVDETFDPNLTFEYRLSIQLSLDGFSFSILDNLQNKVVYLFYQELFDNLPSITAEHLENIYIENDLLDLKYKHTQIHIIAPDKLQLIPQKLYNEKLLKGYQRITFEQDNKFIPLCFDELFFENAICYSTPKAINDFLANKHPNIRAKSILTSWEKSLENFETVAHIHITRRFVSVLIKDKGKLACFNSFVWISEMDLMYFILGCIKNSGVNLQHLQLNGIVNKFSHIYHQLKLYFKHVVLVDKSPEIQYSYLMDKLPDARFIDLFNSFYL